MRRYWIGRNVNEQDVVEGDLFRHIFQVCRHQVGERFELLDDAGHAIAVEVLDIGKRQSLVKKISQRDLPKATEPFVHLAVSVPKIATLERVIEKSVELGVKSVTPFFSDFSFLSNAKKLSDHKWSRFEKIIKAATEQCGRGDIMELRQPIQYTELIRDLNKNNSVMAYENHDLTETLSESPRSEDITVVVGSEGGFSQSEVEAFPGRIISLGPFVLRVETACISLLSQV